MLQALTLSLFGIACVLALGRPAIALALLIFRFPIEQVVQSVSPLFISNQLLMNIILGFIGLMSATVAVARNPRPFLGTFSATWVCGMAIFAFSYVSVAWTHAPEWAMEIIRLGWPYLVIFMLFQPMMLNRLRDVREMGWALMVVGGTLSLLMMVNPNFSFWSSRLLLELDASRKSNSLEIGSLGAIVAICAAVVVPRSQSWFSLAVRGVAFFSGLGIAILSGSRGQVMVGLVIAVGFMPLSRRLANVKGFFLTMGALAVVLGLAVVVARFFVTDVNEARWSSESLLFGGVERWDNVVDLLGFYLGKPVYWLGGLGYYSFHDLPTRSAAPYSHVLTADMLGELGLVGLTLYAVVVGSAINAGIKLYRQVSKHDELRSPAALLLALAVFEFLLAHKQGSLWGAYAVFFYAALVARLQIREAYFAAEEERADDFEALQSGASEEVGVPTTSASLAAS